MAGRSFDDANAFQRTMRTIAATKVGAALLRPTATHLDQLVSRLTDGRRNFTGIVTGVPAVLLTTTGAKSGEPRTVAVSIEGDTWRATARPAAPGERDEIWAKGVEIYPGWRKYEARAGERKIEAFVLSRN